MIPNTPQPQLDWINAIFGPVIGFFAGAAIGYAIQLGAQTTWWIGLIVLAACSLVAAIVLLADHFLRRVIDTIFNFVGLGNGIKPSTKKHKQHWFNKVGWLVGIGVGVLAVLILPEGILP